MDRPPTTGRRPVRRLGADAGRRDRPRPTRVLLDVRPLQEPERSPVTAAYLDALLGAYAADPLPGEELVVLLQAGLADPTAAPRLAALPVAGRRTLPPSRLLRSGALTTDPFLLRSASLLPSIGRGGRPSASRAFGGGPFGRRASAEIEPAGTLFHTASGSVPIASRLPVVVTLLDLAPWQLPGAFQRSPAARFGQRLRARILRDAAIVIVPSAAAATAARRLIHLPAGRLRVVALAPRDEFATLHRRRAPATASFRGDLTAATVSVAAADGALGLDLPARYLVYPGRFDARHDLATLFHALADLSAAGRPADLPEGTDWPPRVVLAEATPADRADVARAAAGFGVGELISYLPHLPIARLAAVVAGARAVVLPVVSATSALSAIEAVAAGTPVVASAVGSLPDAVGGAGLLVAPADPRRLAVALTTIWVDDAAHGRLVRAASTWTRSRSRTWADVAAETRAIYAEAVAAGKGSGTVDEG